MINVAVNAFSGGAYDIGFRQGKKILAKDPHFKSILTAPEFIQATPENFNAVRMILQEFDPPLLEEMRGFADALQVDYQDVTVKLSGYGLVKIVIPHACTQLAVLLGENDARQVLVGRNYDYIADPLLCDFRLVIMQSGDCQHSIGTSQFVFGRIEGMNREGLYVGSSFAHGKGRNERGLFFSLIIRILLDRCRNAAEALEMIKRLPHSYAFNYLLADAGVALAVEVSPPKFAVRRAENDYLVVVNHYLAPEMKAEQKRLMINSLVRQQLAKSKAPGIKGFEDLRDFLSGHAGQGVCQHDYAGYFGTLWSGIFAPAEGRAYYAFGTPCLNQYQVFDLKTWAEPDSAITGLLAGRK